MAVGQIGRPGVLVCTRVDDIREVIGHVPAATQHLYMAGITVLEIILIPELAILDLVLVKKKMPFFIISFNFL